MVESLRGFSSEVTRVAREVGTEGRLGGQARVLGVAGCWKVRRIFLVRRRLTAQDLTDCVNVMAANLTEQVRTIAHATVRLLAGLDLRSDGRRSWRSYTKGRRRDCVRRDLGPGQHCEFNGEKSGSVLIYSRSTT